MNCNLISGLSGPLTSLTVQRLARALERIDNVECGDRLALRVLGIGDRVTDDVLEEDLEDATSFFINQTTDTLDATTTSETTDGRLSDTLNVVAKNFAMALGAASVRFES